MPGLRSTYRVHVATFVLTNRHRPEECRTVFAAWNGFESPLRRREAMASCVNGEHRVFWTAQAEDESGALGQLPPFVAARTEASQVRDVAIP